MSRIKGVSKTFWFVLTTESLSWYKEEDERDKHFMLALDDLKLRDIEQGFMSRRNSYALVNPNGRNVYRVSNCLPCSIRTVSDVRFFQLCRITNSSNSPAKHLKKLMPGNPPSYELAFIP